MNSFVRMCAGAALFLTVLPGNGGCQTLQKDEELVVFPSFAYEGRDGLVHLSFRAWIFEPEKDSLWRKSLVKSVQGFFPAPEFPSEQKTLERRLHGFTADNKEYKSPAFLLGMRSINPGPSGADGHITAEWNLTLPASEKAQLETGALPLTWQQGGRQTPIWISPEGLSVVSDIDDTIKITQVLNRKALVTNSLIKEYQPVPGMPGLYARLAARRAVFHYVSASPWQLYPDLSAFIQKNFPHGTVSLRKLRWKDSSTVDFLWKDSLAYKTSTIAELMERFPKRKFLLIGDSGEKDPEVYDSLRRRFPAQITGILIRIPPEQKSTDRKEGMEYFREPAELELVLKRWGL
ncbi:MAG TPA: App1 family protein [Oligoflexus sp.]|uniref:phosphatidate phosphatase App1 family protein n=1 Tax=Oligoflexus sp. TaxID=1971216 RepID=UPI002D8031F1|nr:App1 family protein [Oligoflexus sp.]HET9235773.1 App1 family protein [Oligoflexus sp.]